MSTVLPREEAVETIFSKILASPEASGRLSGVFYDHIDDDHRLTDNDRDHFLQVLFHAYQNGDISALLLELCGRSMFDLLREAYLIPKKFHGKAGENPVLLTDAAGALPTLIITAATDIGSMMLELAAMSFLGFGAKPPAPEWGYMLNEGRACMQSAPWLMIFPGLAIFVVVVVFNMLGDSIRDILDPRNE